MQELESLGAWQGLLACTFRHRAQLLVASDDRACSAAMLFLIQWAVDPKVRSPQEAQAALTAVSVILAAFREPSSEGAGHPTMACTYVTGFLVPEPSSWCMQDRWRSHCGMQCSLLCCGPCSEQVSAVICIVGAPPKRHCVAQALPSRPC